jgi:predicted acetyltransferase
MSISVTLAPANEKPRLRDILTDYLAELSRYGEVSVDYPFFDSYWHDNDRWPYMIEADGQLAGFALVNTWSPSQRGTDFAVAEFYILPDFRRAGVGRRAFAALLHKHRGVWELSVVSKNEAAKAFWQRTIANAGVTVMDRLTIEDEVVYRFATMD